jgi:NADH-quinone oxidoreductase subunit J
VAEAIYLALSQHIHVGTGDLKAAPNEGNVQAVARVLFTHWALPFEATSVLLVVAVVGVMVVARRKMV